MYSMLNFGIFCVPVADPASGLGDGSSDSAHRCGLSGDTSLSLSPPMPLPTPPFVLFAAARLDPMTATRDPVVPRVAPPATRSSEGGMR
jgi:hypothetical protein